MKTVRELIEELKELPQDMLVYVRGYEDSARDVETAEEIKVIRDYNKGSTWQQEHMIIEEYETQCFDTEKMETGIVIW